MHLKIINAIELSRAERREQAAQISWIKLTYAVKYEWHDQALCQCKVRSLRNISVISFIAQLNFQRLTIVGVD